MEREELLKSKEYWTIQIQNSLFQIINNYMKEKKLSKTSLANEFGVTKSYVTQVLNGDFDHKISKLVELSLASEQVPVLTFLPLRNVITDDLCHDEPLLSMKQRPIEYTTNVFYTLPKTNYYETKNNQFNPLEKGWHNNKLETDFISEI